MENFIELKQKILRAAKDQSACSEQYKRAYASETMSELCAVIKDNFNWCCDKKVLTGSLVDEYKSDFASENIFHNEDVNGAYLIASDSSTVIAYGSSTVRAYGSSYINNHSSIECKISDKAILLHKGIISCCGQSINTNV